MTIICTLIVHQTDSQCAITYMQKDGFRKYPFYYAHLKIIILPQSKNKSSKYTSHGFLFQFLSSTWTSNHPQEKRAKFGQRLVRKFLKIQIPPSNNIGSKTNGLGAKKGCPRAMTKIDPCCLGLRMGALKPPQLAWSLEQATYYL